MSKRNITKEERLYLNAVAEHVGCVVCLNLRNIYTPCCIHHPRINLGFGQRADHRDAIGLCHHHHQGKEGVHTIGKKTWEAKYGTEKELLAQVKDLMEWFDG